MIAILKNEKGVTLLEVLATGIIILVALISIYTGIIYADKQVQRNYHDRVATLHASGEIEWQTFYFKNYKVFDSFVTKSVLIDKLKSGNLMGQMSTRKVEAYETPLGVSITYSILEVTVSWMEPGDKTTRRIVVREDFY